MIPQWQWELDVDWTAERLNPMLHENINRERLHIPDAVLHVNERIAIEGASRHRNLLQGLDELRLGRSRFVGHDFPHLAEVTRREFWRGGL